MIDVKIHWVNGDKQNLQDLLTKDSYQTKSFKDETAAIEWIRRNSAHILNINDSMNFYENQISHFDILRAIRKM